MIGVLNFVYFTRVAFIASTAFLFNSYIIIKFYRYSFIYPSSEDWSFCNETVVYNFEDSEKGKRRVKNGNRNV